MRAVSFALITVVQAAVVVTGVGMVTGGGESSPVVSPTVPVTGPVTGPSGTPGVAPEGVVFPTLPDGTTLDGEGIAGVFARIAAVLEQASD